MNNENWGNVYWNFFHIVTINLNEKKLTNQNIINLNYFFNSMISKISCGKCYNDCKMFFKNNNFNSLSKKREFIIFFYNFHNHVNRKIGKKIYPFNSLNKYKGISSINYLNKVNRLMFNNSISKVWYNFFLFMET